MSRAWCLKCKDNTCTVHQCKQSWKCKTTHCTIRLPVKGMRCPRHEEHQDLSIKTYKSFAEVDRTLPRGRYVRILGGDDPYYDGVYSVMNGGNNAQGLVWGLRIFPCRFRLWGKQGARACQLRRWPGNVSPDYDIPGLSEDDDL